MDPAATIAHVRAHWAGIEPNSPIYNLFFSGIHIVDARREDIGCKNASGGRILARLPVVPIHVNSKHILHGAVSAALIDWAGGMAIAAATGRHQTGVSVDIHVSYVSAARAGDELEIEAWVQRVGQSLAYTSVEIRLRPQQGHDEEDDAAAADAPVRTRGAVVAAGSHTKYVAYGEARKAVEKPESRKQSLDATIDSAQHQSGKIA
ncbi:hypothetical protein SEPCBS57363_000009 [Sporothrix epigloea]|uniref:Thioesterase domain-containing protein n=1 Tax=Sporothrix epigloea TaxID=1892477 RepID=A0ABP0D413_9PEZI